MAIEARIEASSGCCIRGQACLFFIADARLVAFYACTGCCEFQVSAFIVIKAQMSCFSCCILSEEGHGSEIYYSFRSKKHCLSFLQFQVIQLVFKKMPAKFQAHLRSVVKVHSGCEEKA